MTFLVHRQSIPDGKFGDVWGAITGRVTLLPPSYRPILMFVLELHPRGETVGQSQTPAVQQLTLEYLG